MRVAIMSDSHDHVWNLRTALDICSAETVGGIIHCGDLIAPFMLKELARLAGPVHLAFGNNDGDTFLLCRTAFSEVQNMTIHGLLDRVSPDGSCICFSH